MMERQELIRTGTRGAYLYQKPEEEGQSFFNRIFLYSGDDLIVSRGGNLGEGPSLC